MWSGVLVHRLTEPTLAGVVVGVPPPSVGGGIRFVAVAAAAGGPAKKKDVDGKSAFYP